MIIYLVFINVITFIFYGIDKFLAIKKWYRISEFILLLFGLLGGILGSLLAMLFFRHKTRKIKFKLYLFSYFVIWCYILMKFYLT